MWVPPLVLGSLAITSLAGAQAAPLRAPQALRHMHHTSWGPESGIPGTAVPNLLQTPDGYIWFGAGASGGLVRFDGQRFTRIDSATSPALHSARAADVIPLLVDRDGVMWISRTDGAFVQYRDGKFSVPIPADPARALTARAIQDGVGTIWFVARSRRVLTIRNGRIQRPLLPAGVPDSNVFGVVRDTGAGVWIGTNEGVWHVVGNSGRLIPAPESYRGFNRPLRQTPDGKLWVLGKGLTIVDGERWSSFRLNGSDFNGVSLVETSDHQILIAAQGHGLLRVTNGRPEQYSKPEGLSTALARDVMIDRAGNTWVLTDGGLDRFRVSPFTTLDAADRVPFDSPLHIGPDERRGLWAQSLSDGRVYHATGGIVDGDTGAIRWSPARFANRDRHYPMRPAHGGGVWVVSDSDGVQRLRDDGATSFASPEMLSKTPLVRVVYEDRVGTVWLGFSVRGSHPGFGRVRDGVFTAIALEKTGEPGVADVIAEDGRGHIWTSNGSRPLLYELDGDTIIARLDSTAGIRDIVEAMAPAGGDTLWVATTFHLLRLIGRTVTRVRFLNDGELMHGRSVHLVVNGKSLWIATGSGVARMSLAAAHAFADGRGPEPVVRLYSALDGLPLGRVTFATTASAFAARDGRVWFSTPGGLAVYDPLADVANETPPSVQVEEIVADGRLVSAQPALEIPPRPSRVDIHYTATSLRVPERARIEYMLEGADRTWVAGGPLRVATYTQLRPARYRFHVRAWNEDGVPSTGEVILAFRVVPTWYQTTVFRGLVLLLIVAGGPLVLYGVLQRRAKQREAQLHAQFDAALDERTRIARELHDTLLQGFGGVTLQLQAVQHSMAEAPQLASDRLSRVLSLADETMREARQAIWDMRAPELGEHDLAEALESAAQSAIGSEAIALRFTVRGARRRLAPLIEETVLRVGREAIVNAVRHASPRAVEVDLVYGEQDVMCRVRDDGSGFDPEAATAARASGHWGVPGMRERAVHAGGSLDITGVPGGGTQVSLTLPTHAERDKDQLKDVLSGPGIDRHRIAHDG